jgi:hypothetical protein
MKQISAVVATLLLAACSSGLANGDGQGDGWITLLDGTSLDGWRASENPSSFRIENGQLVVFGPRAHLFYDGPVMNHAFRNFELEVEAMTTPGSNSGIFIHTAYQDTGWPSQGYEVQVNNSHTDWRRTGSLYAVQDVREQLVRDGEWFTQHVTVRGRSVQIRVNGRQVVDYTEPADSATRLPGGTIALQAHDPESRVHYRSVRVRPLPD